MEGYFYCTACIDEHLIGSPLCTFQWAEDEHHTLPRAPKGGLKNPKMAVPRAPKGGQKTQNGCFPCKIALWSQVKNWVRVYRSSCAASWAWLSMGSWAACLGRESLINGTLYTWVNAVNDLLYFRSKLMVTKIFLPTPTSNESSG